MNIGSLCSGYGGLDLAVEAIFGATTSWFVEYDKQPLAILAARFPNVPNYGDVKHTDWTALEPVDILTAGYPCQPFSHAGRRNGEEDPRHIWPWIGGSDRDSAIRVLRPRYVVLENVSGHLSLGFGRVLGDLAALGYDARWSSLRASDVGAPHGRLRVFILAERREDATDPHGSGPQGQLEHEALLDWSSRLPSASDRRDAGVADPINWGPYAAAVARWEALTGRSAPAPTEPGKDERPRLAAPFVEWMMGLPEGWVTDVDGLSRTAQLKALGNGVVPQQAYTALAWMLGVDLRATGRVDTLLPTPSASDSTGAEPAEQRAARGAGGAALRDLPSLLPTPTPFQMDNRETPAEWLKRRKDVVARTGTHHGLPLPVAAVSIAEGRPILMANPTASEMAWGVRDE